MKPETEIKNLVQTAIRQLEHVFEGKKWTPLQGGQFAAMNGAVITFNKPTRFCPAATYSVLHPLFGKYGGKLSGAVAKNIGRPSLIYTKEQLEKNNDRTQSAAEICAAALAV